MNKYYRICLSATLFLTIFLLAGAGYRERSFALASRIAPEVLRFHVIANSDSRRDQEIKLKVKDFLLEEIQTGLLELQEESSEGSSERSSVKSSVKSSEGITKKMVCQYVTDHRSELEQAASAHMAALGVSCTADIRIEPWEFPEKIYGDMVFPAGTYDAVRVILGEGRGQNFWCVLYPTLCYLDSTHAVVPDESKALLKTVIPEEDFSSLLMTRSSGYQIRFKTLPWLNRS